MNMKYLACLSIALVVGCSATDNSNFGIDNIPPPDNSDTGNSDNDTGIPVDDSGVATDSGSDDSQIILVPDTSNVVDSVFADSNDGTDSGLADSSSSDSAFIDDGNNSPDSSSGDSVGDDTGLTADSGVVDSENTDSGSVDSGVTDSGPGDSCSKHTCVYTQGYWKTHPTKWTTSSLVLGNVYYSEAECISLMDLSSSGDASLILEQQLVAALLNGGESDPSVGYAVAAAQAWMISNKDADGLLPFGVDPSSVAGQSAVDLATTLDAFNSGMMDLPHCE